MHFETLKFKKKSELFFDGPLTELSVNAKTSYVLLWLGDEGQEQKPISTGTHMGQFVYTV